jgi:hypothetical protein
MKGNAHAACALVVDLDDGLALRAVEGDPVDLAHEREVLLLARRGLGAPFLIHTFKANAAAKIQVRDLETPRLFTGPLGVQKASYSSCPRTACLHRLSGTL